MGYSAPARYSPIFWWVSEKRLMGMLLSENIACSTKVGLEFEILIERGQSFTSAQSSNTFDELSKRAVTETCHIRDNVYYDQ